MMRRTDINATWCISSNVGDRITPFLVEQLTGRPPIYAGRREGRHLVGCGSILNWAEPENIVWGAGLASFTDEVNPAADIRCVRGPLSRARAMACGCAVPDVCGDPALLVPRFAPSSAAVPGRIGVVPHYVDHQRASWWFGGDNAREEIVILDVLQDVRAFVAELTTCCTVFSSSLHGLILADAYGIPNAWVRMGEDVEGDDMKFYDHLAAVGRPVAPPIDLAGAAEAAAIVAGAAARVADRYVASVSEVAGRVHDAFPVRNGVLK